jgi:glycosyltransferase involved in cell wall biosynthesis
MKLSLIICTHNPRRDYLFRTLEALREQTLQVDEWELLLIDNALCPAADTMVSLAWHPEGRFVREEVLGLTPARLRGIQEAQGEVLVFVDDDSLLESSYLEVAMHIAESRPELGCWGAGLIQAEYEKRPPEWLVAYDGALAIRQLDRDMWANIIALNRSLGMCVRRKVAVQYASLCQRDSVRRSLDRSGKLLASCGDTDIAMLSCAIGMGTASFMDRKSTHLIPESRTTSEYMSRLIAGKAESQVVLSSLYKDANDDVSFHRLRLLKLKYLFFWFRYMASGFSVHFRMALSKAGANCTDTSALEDSAYFSKTSLIDNFRKRYP